MGTLVVVTILGLAITFPLSATAEVAQSRTFFTGVQASPLDGSLFLHYNFACNGHHCTPWVAEAKQEGLEFLGCFSCGNGLFLCNALRFLSGMLSFIFVDKRHLWKIVSR